MATCSLCGKSCGLMSGGKEPYTGHDLFVCNECGVLFKKVDKAIADLDNEAFEKYKEEVENATKGKDLDSIIAMYFKSADRKFEEYKRNEELNKNEKNKTGRKCPVCQRNLEWGENVCSLCGNTIIQKNYYNNEDKVHILDNKKEQIYKNALYEYKVKKIRDSYFSGEVNADELEDTIMRYALEGWKLHTVFTNELGKNALMALGIGTNATIDEVIMIFERKIRNEL